MKSLKRNINNLGELKSIVIVDLNWDTKTLDINQLENANWENKHSIITKIDWNLL